MTKWVDYVAWTKEVSIYAGVGTGNTEEIVYVSQGFSGESMEMAGKILGLSSVCCSFFERELLEEMGDSFYYHARFCQIIDLVLGSRRRRVGLVVRTSSVVSESYLKYLDRAKEIPEMLKKLIRSQGLDAITKIKTDPETRVKFAERISSSLSALRCLCTAIGVSPEEVLEINQAKLLKRKAAGTLHERPK